MTKIIVPVRWVAVPLFFMLKKNHEITTAEPPQAQEASVASNTATTIGESTLEIHPYIPPLSVWMRGRPTNDHYACRD